MKTFDPTTNLMLLWGFITFAFNIIALFYIPLEIINGELFNEKYGISWVLYKKATVFIFLLDIILKFNIGLFEKGTIIFSKKEIAKFYLKNSFFIDFCSLISSLQAITNFDPTEITNLIILFKIKSAR